MTNTDPPASVPPEDSAQDDTTGDETIPFPNLRELRWPIVQALREIGASASDTELAEHVADAMGLTHEQRTAMIPSGRETRLRNRVSWAAHELKEIEVLHYPEPGRRALTPLGLEVDEDRIRELRAEFKASKPSSAQEQQEGKEQADAVTAWLIRAGQGREHYDYNLEHGLAGLGWRTPDLRSVSGREEVEGFLRSDYPDEKAKTISTWASQMLRLLNVRVGDLVVTNGSNREISLGTVTREYRFDDDDPAWPHAVSVDWKRIGVPLSTLKQDLRNSLGAQQSLCAIERNDGAWRLHQLMETGQDPGPRAESDGEDSDLAELVERFRDETGYPTDAHGEQERLRAEWAEKLAPANVASLSREDLLGYTNNAVAYGDYVDLGEGRTQQWIDDLDDAGYDRLLNSIHDLCWGEGELPARIDRLADQVGGFNRDTGTLGFTGLQASRTLAICHPDRFLPVPNHEGEWGRVHMLRRLGLPAPSGTTYGQRVVDANDRLRKHLASHLDDDPQAIAGFLYWLRRQAGPGGGNEPGEPGDEDLSSLIARFRESGYPTEAHEEQRRLQAEWAKKLTPENIADLSRLDLTAVASHGTWYSGIYVYPHAQGVMQWIRDLDDDEYSRMLDHIRYLCSDDEDELWRRYDQLTDSRSNRRTKGLAHSTTSQLLAITHPQDFLAICVQGGKWGRAAMLRRLGLPKPTGSSYGQRVIDADRRLREHLEPHFSDDTPGMSAFLGWMLDQEPPPPPGPIGLAELADELLVDVAFLEDIVELLKDKGQVILYGPPGTGKTYLARKLAAVLAPDESCRALVQFHPSTSYEDFFEGYRPAEADEDGGIRYKLTHGPLARMAEQASEAFDQHVMIIDEINRGNLPRVLGELLFLLEYRDERVQTLYRPAEPFELPDNLWFIGTMNTADRSIALVDAALRRRFHFVPFFPDSGPMAGLLTRWLKREDQPDWIGRLVDAVNDELTRELGGSHLLLGPSHFMREFGPSLAEQRQQLRRIWEYNIEPFIEDQFFGNPEQIDSFRFDSVMGRHGPSGGREAGTSRDPRDSEHRLAPESSEQGLASAGSGDDRELWTRRASDFPPEDHPGDESYHAEMSRVVRRYVEFAMDRGSAPGSRDDQLVEAFLSSREPEYADKTKSDYRGHIRKWFDYAEAKWGI